MASKARLRGFTGNLIEYVTFLEELVLSLERKLSQQLQAANVPPQFPLTQRQPLRSDPPTQQSSQPPSTSTNGPVTSPPTRQPSQIQPLTQESNSSQSSTQLSSRTFTFQIETLKRQPPKSTDNKGIVREFLGQIPKDEAGWLARRKQVQLHEAGTVLHTFTLLTRCTSRIRSQEIDPALHKPDLTTPLEDYGHFLDRVGAHKVFATQISHYSTLLFVCIAIIARKIRPVDAVDVCMKRFLTIQQGKDCNAQTKYLSRLRSGALWAVHIMEGLADKGLKHRGPEAFLLCMFPI
ncbi:hypothetical protein P154DRAFT_232813 [Amniculicola lignicola CBS 123094]|uniref:Uncharacterized protein n=1 Tax=Amniculicola lignicola CBS 123094 TaxID=1392246 RepID=A0A6A5WEF1_9PLEO|nr:hypothetical protein P154DRAFT_232813 [Amniculicola lignicola CBS 123094]